MHAVGGRGGGSRGEKSTARKHENSTYNSHQRQLTDLNFVSSSLGLHFEVAAAAAPTGAAEMGSRMNNIGIIV